MLTQRRDDRSLIARIRSRGLTIKKRKKRVPVAVYPSAVEMAMRRDLLQITRAARTILQRVLLPRLPLIMEQAQQLQRSDADERRDDYASIITQVFGEIRVEFERVFASAARSATTMAARRVADHSRGQLDKQIKAVIGVDVMQDESWLNPFIDGFVSQNVDLIRSIPARFFSDIETAVRDAALSGQRVESLAVDIESRYDVSESRARLLARDQVSKLNGDITQVRQTRLGIKTFTWSTSMDERVRASHKAKEGKVYNWASPPTDTGKPGDDYQCRCVALPNFDEIEAAIDSE